MQVEHEGRTLNVGVDRAPNSYGVYLPTAPAWSDQTPVSGQELDGIKSAIVEIMAYWNTSVEFSDE
jgi:hypothetical protein